MLNPLITRTQVREAYAALVVLAGDLERYGGNPTNPAPERAVVNHCADRLRAILATLETP